MTMLLQLRMNVVPVRLGTLPRRLRRNRLAPKQLGFQFLFAPAFGQRPTDAGRSCPLQIVVDRAQPHPATARDLPLPQPQLQPQPQDFLRFPHGHSPCRHSVLLMDGVSLPGNCPASLPPTAARLWKTFRSKLNTIPVDEHNCSPSHRNGVHLQTRNAVRNHNGMVFRFRPESRSPSTGFPRQPGTLGTLNALFPRGAYFGPKFALIGPANLLSVHPQFMFHPLLNVTGCLEWIWFWRESTKDALYSTLRTCHYDRQTLPTRATSAATPISRVAGPSASYSLA